MLLTCTVFHNPMCSIDCWAIVLFSIIQKQVCVNILFKYFFVNVIFMALPVETLMLQIAHNGFSLFFFKYSLSLASCVVLIVWTKLASPAVCQKD